MTREGKTLEQAMIDLAPTVHGPSDVIAELLCTHLAPKERIVIARFDADSLSSWTAAAELGVWRAFLPSSCCRLSLARNTSRNEFITNT
jgi:hypothetical protein